ncbi:helix-turn-helix domain-containing protein [Streptomyces sp. 1222.5]|uniref:helix-turn-helix domain-containing protein n=1 Tax=Streptomyces sp. 1222.5 TaxID=1881026 RepID=UPI003D71204A
MGRPQKPITSSPALAELAQWLRDQRSRQHLTYRQMAHLSDLHATTLQRAAAGASVPTLAVVEGYARACRADQTVAHRLWRAARYEACQKLGQRGNAQLALRPELVRDFADLALMMRELHLRAGAPSLRALQHRAGSHGELPRSTLHRMLSGRTLPSYDHLVAFVKGCGASRETTRAWQQAWHRAERTRRSGEGAETSFRADLLHELRSPLTSVLGFSATLLAKWDRFTGDQKRLMVETVDADARRISSLLSDMSHALYHGVAADP